MSHSEVNLENFLIPVEEIDRAKEFSSFTCLGSHGYFRGQLSEAWKNRKVIMYLKSKVGNWRRRRTGNMDRLMYDYRKELEILTWFHHENIILLIGFCDEDDEMVMVCEDVNASLVEYLDNREKRHQSWGERLKICIGIAKGLSYLHSGVEEVGKVIHKDVQSRNIMLDEDLVPKISGFDHSVLFPPNQPYAKINASACPENDRDPIYHETGLLNTQTDIYSYGIVMFEMLIGMVADQEKVVGDYKPQRLINIVRRCYDDRHEQLIDPSLRDHIDRRSFHMFTDIAYKCISLNIKDRPTMDEIVKTIEEALDIHNQGAPSRKLKLELQKKFLIPLEEINKASSVFQEITESRPFNKFYKGYLYDRWKKGPVAIKKCIGTPFQNELMLVSRLHHENIIPFIGYCDEDRMTDIIVYEWAENGSVFSYLKKYSLSWAQRLKICIGASRGLKYLHSGLGEYESIIHGDFDSKHILLSKNLEAQICGLSSSSLVPKNHSDTKVYKTLAGNLYPRDPAYRESYIPKIESNVYSLGIVLFEILTGMRADEKSCIGDEELNMVTLVRRYCNDGFEKYIDPRIRDEIDAPSFHTFKEIAYKCISYHIKDRPSVNKIIKRLEEALYTQKHGAASTISRINQKLEDFRIPLKDINSAIGVKGQETRIGDGGFGVVYKGQPSERWQNRTVAIKCLRSDSYQGEHEFRNELNMIFNFNHENIIPFIGYCDEDNEKIIVYEYASNGSLDSHLSDKNKRRFLTWEHRLKICLGAAKGLDYLHSGLGEDHRVIHRDVKSGNILLDHNLEAKVCDFGLSKSGPINQQHTQLYTNAAGTNFYMDPVYHESGVLRKESDVYSFGVVMFELLSGMLAYNRRKLEGGKPKPLVNIVRRYYNYKPELIIDPLIRDEIDGLSFNTFREVAFQCISFNSKERPTMEMIVDRIEEALELREHPTKESIMDRVEEALELQERPTMETNMDRVEEALELQEHPTKESIMDRVEEALELQERPTMETNMDRVEEALELQERPTVETNVDRVEEALELQERPTMETNMDRVEEALELQKRPTVETNVDRVEEALELQEHPNKESIMDRVEEALDLQERPTMETIVDRVEEALELQERPTMETIADQVEEALEQIEADKFEGKEVSSSERCGCNIMECAKEVMIEWFGWLKKRKRNPSE